MGQLRGTEPTANESEEFYFDIACPGCKENNWKQLSEHDYECNVCHNHLNTEAFAQKIVFKE